VSEAEPRSMVPRFRLSSTSYDRLDVQLILTSLQAQVSAANLYSIVDFKQGRAIFESYLVSEFTAYLSYW
jgi:hypothetical protein